MWLLGVVVRMYIYFLILLIPTPLVSFLFCSSIPTFCSQLQITFKINSNRVEQTLHQSQVRSIGRLYVVQKRNNMHLYEQRIAE